MNEPPYILRQCESLNSKVPEVIPYVLCVHLLLLFLLVLAPAARQQLPCYLEDPLVESHQGHSQEEAKAAADLANEAVQVVNERLPDEQERDPFTDLRRLLQSSDLTLTGILSDYILNNIKREAFMT